MITAWRCSWLLACACTPTSPAAPSRAGEPDVVALVSEALVRDGCAQATAAPPAWRDTVSPESFDLVVYTAHPDDEAMYAGGTMDLLVRAHRRVAFVAMSHGEGGRLLERASDGHVVERRDYPRSHVIEVRDREIADAAQRIEVTVAQLYPGTANVDDAWTTSCPETLARWQHSLPEGIAGMLRRVVADVRARKPRVVITLDPRDDPQASHHGHHKAVGVVVEAAVRLAADPRVRDGGAPHVVEELLTMAPRGLPEAETITIPVKVDARIRMLDAYPSQFTAEELAVDAIAQRPNEQFVLRWRASGAPAIGGGARLIDLTRFQGDR